LFFSRLVARWKGLTLTLVAAIATAWLGVTGQLGLYIHPRYYVFTLIMAGIALVLTIGAFIVVPGPDEHDEHEHDLDLAGPGGPDGHGLDSRKAARAGRRRPLLAFAGSLAALVIIASAAIGLLVVPPSALTSAAVEQRSLNGSSNSLSNAGPVPGTSDDTSAYSVKDWATLIRQGASADDLSGKTATLTGFVTPDADDPDNVFYVARFVVTCCAVDAQPVGVPVYSPGWSSSYKTDSWVTVTGEFEANPSVLSTATTVVSPDSLTQVEQPAEPYVY
jgi:uncharacterized repeat protein (TIGR03943 family)